MAISQQNNFKCCLCVFTILVIYAQNVTTNKMFLIIAEYQKGFELWKTTSKSK